MDQAGHQGIVLSCHRAQLSPRHLQAPPDLSQLCLWAPVCCPGRSGRWAGCVSNKSAELTGDLTGEGAEGDAPASGWSSASRQASRRLPPSIGLAPAAAAASACRPKAACALSRSPLSCLRRFATCTAKHTLVNAAVKGQPWVLLVWMGSRVFTTYCTPHRANGCHKLDCQLQAHSSHKSRMHQSLAVICGKGERRPDKPQNQSPVSLSKPCIPQSISLSYWLDTTCNADSSG